MEIFWKGLLLFILKMKKFDLKQANHGLSVYSDKISQLGFTNSIFSNLPWVL